MCNLIKIHTKEKVLSRTEIDKLMQNASIDDNLLHTLKNITFEMPENIFKDFNLPSFNGESKLVISTNE